MKISQEKARIAADELTKKAYENVKALEKAYIDMVIGYYNAQLPGEVIAFARKYPQHTSFSDYINFDGHGFNKEYVYVHPQVISNVEGYARALLKLTPKAAETLRKAKDKWKDAAKACEDLKRETRMALLNLGTTTRIQEKLPMAMPFLGSAKPKYPVPAVNIGPLRAKLEKLAK